MYNRNYINGDDNNEFRDFLLFSQNLTNTATEYCDNSNQQNDNVPKRKKLLVCQEILWKNSNKEIPHLVLSLKPKNQISSLQIP